MPTHLVQRGITRYDKDQNISNGYMVRVTRDGTTHSQFFSDSKCGGKRKALQAARVAYEDLVAALPSVRTTKNVKTDRNRSGKVGVHLAETVSAYGETYGAYCASWKTRDGRRAKISFAFKKYGKRASFQLACLARDMETVDRDRVETRFSKMTGNNLNRLAKKSAKVDRPSAKPAAPQRKKVAGRNQVSKGAAKSGKKKSKSRSTAKKKPAGNKAVKRTVKKK